MGMIRLDKKGKTEVINHQIIQEERMTCMMLGCRYIAEVRNLPVVFAFSSYYGDISLVSSFLLVRNCFLELLSFLLSSSLVAVTVSQVRLCLVHRNSKQL